MTIQLEWERYNNSNIMLTFSQCRPSRYCSILLSLFLGPSWVPNKIQSCNLNSTGEGGNVTTSRTNSSINRKVQSSFVSSFLEQTLVYSCFILSDIKIPKVFKCGSYHWIKSIIVTFVLFNFSF